MFFHKIKTSSNKKLLLPLMLILTTQACSYIKFDKSKKTTNRVQQSAQLQETVSTNFPKSAFVTKWKTDNEAVRIQEDKDSPTIPLTTTTQIQLPLHPRGKYNFNVDWGDGTTSQISSWDDKDKIHNYKSAGKYIISITGLYSQFSFEDMHPIEIQYANEDEGTDEYYITDELNYLSDPKKLIDVIQWGENNWQSMEAMFAGVSQVTEFSATDIPNTTNVTNMARMFSGATAFNQKLNFDTKQVTTMASMFENAITYNQPIQFNTINVKDMSRMFTHARSFNQPIDFDTQNVEKMNAMFNDAESFNQPLHFDTSKVLDMNSMFKGANKFNQPVNFNTFKVTNMSAMFENCKAFNQPVLFNTMSVADMNRMFAGAKDFNQMLNFNTSKVKNMTLMFINADSFRQNLINWKVNPNVKSCDSFGIEIPFRPVFVNCKPKIE